ncbi:RNA repair transcriptional activator RtcR [Desulfogranum japonicum]|uniref:RNA repair transcriptional activator RtcR n=1 Tax=Desulfogranum japonicum TaxID=231447 RepID=UPI00042A7394|nr:RNA repair transcriptional activator RtcR [Desulfogranum japonicum]
MSKNIVIGLLGSTLDNTGKGSKRWERWRPTVSLCQHEDFLIDRLDLLYQKEFRALLNRTIKDIHTVSPETEIVPHEITMHNPWDFEEVFSVLHDFSMEYCFEQENNYLVHISTGSHVAQICLFLLTEAHYFPARLIQSGPGRGRNSLAPGTFSLIDLDLSKYDHIAGRFQKLQHDDISLLKSGIQTRNTAFNQLIARIERVAIRSVDPILLTGPTGAGKSRLADRIYQLKKQRTRLQGPLVEINCATLQGDNAMAALFGHTSGAFTGATGPRAGLLKTADQGMLFLDEIGELGLDEQAMLLRAIEKKQFLPVGADKEVTSTFQLICGTNKDLPQACAQGKFREDLLARINLWTFHMPGLRDRKEDIEPNFDYELDKFSSRTGRRVTINTEARTTFLSFATSPVAAWKANFRDLGGAVTRMATLAPGGRITIQQVKEELQTLQQGWTYNRDDEDTNDLVIRILGTKKAEQIDDVDKATLTHVLKTCQNSSTLAEAGRRLFNVSRMHKRTSNDTDRLRKYLAKYDLDWQQIQRILPKD